MFPVSWTTSEAIPEAPDPTEQTSEMVPLPALRHSSGGPARPRFMEELAWSGLGFHVRFTSSPKFLGY